MKGKYKILRKELNRLIEDATVSAEERGAEICGILVDNGYFIELIKVRNKVKKGGGFAFYKDEIRFIQKAAAKMNHEIIGTFHSHPMYIAEPSDSDIENALDDSLMLIIDVLDKEIGLWHIKDQKRKRLEFALL